MPSTRKPARRRGDQRQTQAAQCGPGRRPVTGAGGRGRPVAPIPLKQPGAAGCSAALLWVLCGCSALAPPPQGALPDDLPTAWSAAAPARPATTLVDWWRRFDDPVLGQLVGEALHANTTVLGAQAALRQARALREAAAAGLGPTLDASASAQRGSRGGQPATRAVQVGLDAQWPVDLSGGRRAALDAAEAAAQGSAASLGQARVAVAAELGLNYITLRLAQARLAIASHNLALQQETWQLTVWRVQAGLLSSLEGEQARAAAAQTQAQLPALQAGVERSLHALAVLTGQAPAALNTRAALVAVLEAPRPLPQADGELALSLPADTLRQRADVRAAEHAVTAAAARASQARAARLPALQIGGSIGLSALALGGLGPAASRVSSLLASVSLPLFDGGAARAQVGAQDAALEQAQAAYRASVLQALKDVEDALVALRGDRERVVHLQDAAEAAARAAWMASQRFRSGLADFQTVLDTQRTQLSLQDGLAGAQAELGADHVRLYLALGGGWVPDPLPLSTPPHPAARP